MSEKEIIIKMITSTEKDRKKYLELKEFYSYKNDIHMSTYMQGKISYCDVILIRLNNDLEVIENSKKNEDESYYELYRINLK